MPHRVICAQINSAQTKKTHSPSSIKITEFASGVLFDTGWVIILKSSSNKNGAFHRCGRGVVRGVVTGDEYKLKLVGLITPDIVDIELE